MCYVIVAKRPFFIRNN